MITQYTARNGAVFDVMHTADGMELMKEILARYKFYLVVELGYAAGGLTAMIHDTLPECFVRSFDVRKVPPLTDEQADAFNGRVGFIQADLLPGPDPVVLNYLRWPNRKLLYCDNGDKTREVVTYAPHLHKGDILGIHDWSEAKLDASPSVLTPFLTRLGFDPYMHDEFEASESLARFFIRESEGI